MWRQEALTKLGIRFAIIEYHRVAKMAIRAGNIQGTPIKDGELLCKMEETPE